MRTIKLDIDDVRSNIIRNRYITILIIVICLLFGIVYGIYQKNNYSKKEKIPFIGEKEITISDIEQDEQYYFEAFNRIKAEADCLDIYYKYFQAVKMSSKNKEELRIAKENFNDYYDTHKDTDDYFWATPLSKADADKAITFYNNKIEDLKEKKLYAEKNLQVGKDNGGLTDKEKKEIEARLTRIDLSISKMQNLIRLLKEADYEQIKQNNEEADRMLMKDVEKINENIVLFNNLIKEISTTESYDIIFNKHIITDQGAYFGLIRLEEDETLLKNRVQEAIIYAKSVESLDVGSERMHAIITFFALFGIVLAFLVGALYTLKDKKEERK